MKSAVLVLTMFMQLQNGLNGHSGQRAVLPAEEEQPNEVEHAMGGKQGPQDVQEVIRIPKCG